jgi:hypothetical protein
MYRTIKIRIGDSHKSLRVRKTAKVQDVLATLQNDYPDVTLNLEQNGVTLAPHDNVYFRASRPFTLTRNDFLAHIPTTFEARSTGQVKKYCLSALCKYSNVKLCLERRPSCSTTVDSQAITFKCPLAFLALVEALLHRRFVVMVSRGRAENGNFFKDVSGVFVFVFVELGEFATYRNALSAANGFEHHIVIPMPPGYEARGAPTPRQFAKLFVEQLNDRLRTKATHYLMVDDDWEMIVHRETDKPKQSVDAGSFIEDLFNMGQANPHLALIGLRPEKHLGTGHPNECGLTGHIEKTYLVSLALTRDIQYLPQMLLCLNTAEWNRKITLEAQHLAEEIYDWKCKLRDYVALYRGQEGSAKEHGRSQLVKEAKSIGLKSKDCTSMEAQVVREMQRKIMRPRREELEMILTQFKLTKKTCLTTGEDYRFAGQSLEKNGLGSCMMLNWFYVKELRVVAKNSENQTGSFFPTPVRQHERILRYT